MNRRHDIDALRALAFALVIAYHLAMAFVAGWPWHLKSQYTAEWLQWPMRALNLWRMDLVFLVSGLAFGFLQRGQTRFAVWRQRSLRLLLPLGFGMAVVVPWQPYAQGVTNGLVAPGFGAFLLKYFTGGPWPAGAFDGWEFGVTWNHLWYLPYLWLYTSVLLVLRPALTHLGEVFRRLRGARLLLAPALPLVLYSLLLWPRFPPTHDLIHDAWLHAVYFTLFAYGHWIGTNPPLWDELVRLRRVALAWAVAAFLLYGVLRSGLPTPTRMHVLARVAGDFYLWAVIVAVLGFAARHLNHPWRWLAWARESVYPWYLLHQTLIIAGLVWLAPLPLGPWQQPLALLAITVLGCWLLTDGLIRRVAWLRPLFGLNPPARPRCPSPARTAHPAGRSV